MRVRRAALLAVTLSCAGAGGPALAAVAGSAGHGGPVASVAAETAPINSVTLTSTQPTASSTTATSTSATTSTTPSSTTTTPAPQLLVCLGSVRRVIGRRLGVHTASIASRQFLATNGMPQCNFVIARAHRGGPAGKVVLTANVDNGPQAHWRLMRKVVEATQIFGPTPKGFRPPFQVRGLGPNGSWFPALDQMMANNLGGRYIITVGVIWHRSTQAEKIAITRAVTLVYRHIRRLPA